MIRLCMLVGILLCCVVAGGQDLLQPNGLKQSETFGQSPFSSIHRDRITQRDLKGVSDQPLVNGDLRPIKPFMLLLITEQQSRDGVNLIGMLQQPRREMIPIMEIADSKILNISDDRDAIVEKHRDIVDRVAMSGGTLPVLAIVDDEGGCWGTFSAPNLPRSEYDLANLCKTTFAAGLTARKRAIAEGREPPDGPTNPVRYLDDSLAQSLLSYPGSSYPGDSYGGPFTPTIRPQIVPPDGGLNARLDTSATATVDSETRNWAMTMLLVAGFIVLLAVYLHGRAITDKPDDVDDDA